MDPEFAQELFRMKDLRTFRDAALKVFYYQAEQCPVYAEYLARLGVEASRIRKLEEVPFLPVEFFRTHTVISGGRKPEATFESSGTTGREASRHHVADLSLYRKSLTEAFGLFYGSPDQYCILALLPSYLERSGSSLVHMMDHLIALSGHPDSGFYLHNLEELSRLLQMRNNDRHPTLLLGVSFALLDLAERYPLRLGPRITIMETGGMKGRGKELIRSDLHGRLGEAFGKRTIHSEYGMTEMLSQAYSRGEGIFHSPPWMKAMIRDPDDPFSLVDQGITGGLNIIDLANLYSCSFLATGDLGKTNHDGSFEVLGRFDHSDVRGCNLLVT